MGVLVLLLGLVGCASGDGDGFARDPSASPTGTAVPTDVPAADGPVRSRGLATVMDTGRPELCLGPVAESWPPQCGGPLIDGWQWSAYDGMFERQDEVRWGQFAVTGRWDGTSFAVTEAIPAALYDAAATSSPSSPSSPPAPSGRLPEDELASIAALLGSRLPGALGAYTADGRVLIDVVHDDGSLQAWADREFGDGVVIVTSALVDADTR